MKVGIYKTTTTVSSPVSIPLSNPVDKFDLPYLEQNLIPSLNQESFVIAKFQQKNRDCRYVVWALGLKFLL